MLTVNDVVYVSRDHGFNWESAEDKLIKSAFINEFSSKGRKICCYVRVASVFQHPKNSDMFIIHGNGKISCVTNDCGNTFFTLNHGRQAYRFTFHPEFDSYVLGLFKADNCTGDSCSEYGSLALSKY